MNEELEKKLEKLGMTPGEALNKAKKRYRDAKTVRTYTNEIRRDEQKYFKDDEYLIGLVVSREILDQEIEQHIDRVLTTARANPQHEESIQEKVQKDIEARTVN